MIVQRARGGWAAISAASRPRLGCLSTELGGGGILGGMGEEREHVRAADADRQAVADRLRVALDEGRLDFHEYDTRLRDAYAAKTYGDLDRLTADLPQSAGPGIGALRRAAAADVAPTGSAVETTAAPAGPVSDATRRWLIATWDDYAAAVTICVAIWLVIVLTGGGWAGLWPLWVAGPWGAYLVYETAKGLATGEPQRWATRQDHRRALKEQRRSGKEQRRSGKRSLPRAPDDPDVAEV